MLVVIPTHAGDVLRAVSLLQWLQKLNTYQSHDCLIVADADTPSPDVMSLQEVAYKIFRETRLTTNERATHGWPAGCYSLFKAAQRFVTDYWTQPYLILEPDAVPLRKTWLDEIEAAYKSCGKPFMGQIYDCAQPGMPTRLMSGIAVYPAECIAFMPPVDMAVHWDVFNAEVMVNNGSHTPLIKHFFGQINLAPVFVHARNVHSPANALTLDFIPPEAVIFHRDKTQSLIRLLDRKYFQQPHRPITVCFPVHAGDLSLAVEHARWLKQMNIKWKDHRAVVCHEPSCPVVGLNTFEDLLRSTFGTVDNFCYPRPPIPGYPQAANWMFQNIAHFMATQKNPWLLFEADAVALVPNWLQLLQEEYLRCGQDWMGPHVKGMSHANGSMIYPPDAAARMPKAMTCSDQAWDYHGSSDYMADCHDASHLFQHLWSIVGEDPCEVGGGQIPAGVTVERARRWLKPGAVVVHRIKDASLIQLLMSGAYRP